MSKKPLSGATAPAQDNDIELAPRSLTKQEFGKRLYKLMIGKGWNQSQLARYADIGRDSVSQYVRGRTFPTPQNLASLAKALSVKPEELLPNYLESAIDREQPEIEIKGVHGDKDHMWVRINMRLPRMKALRILAVIHDEDINS